MRGIRGCELSFDLIKLIAGALYSIKPNDPHVFFPSRPIRIISSHTTILKANFSYFIQYLRTLWIFVIVLFACAKNCVESSWEINYEGDESDSFWTSNHIGSNDKFYYSLLVHAGLVGSREQDEWFARREGKKIFANTWRTRYGLEYCPRKTVGPWAFFFPLRITLGKSGSWNFHVVTNVVTHTHMYKLNDSLMGNTSNEREVRIWWLIVLAITTGDEISVRSWEMTKFDAQ